MIRPKNLKQFNSKKILKINTLKKKIINLKKKRKKVGLCIGGYDLLHPGHALHFKAAKKLCDVLIVGITTDEFVQKRKGIGRPIYSQELRTFFVSQIESVDFVVLSPYKTAVDLIKKLKPDIYIKGPDYIRKTTPGITSERAAIQEVGGIIKYTEEEKLATTEIINYIKKMVR